MSASNVPSYLYPYTKRTVYGPWLPSWYSQIKNRISDHQEYCGYTNIDTFKIAMHIDNDSALHTKLYGAAKVYARNSSIMLCYLTKTLQNMRFAFRRDINQVDEDGVNLSQVDWLDIAETMITKLAYV
jgi:hypothetical protein